MARKKLQRAAAGAGSISQKTVTRNGKKYVYWIGKVTVGYDSGTGKQIKREITGKTQAEVLEKMQAVQTELKEGNYIEPSKITVSAWLDIWLKEYCVDTKSGTHYSYEKICENHIKPALGAIKLQAVKPPDVQKFVNGLKNKANGNPLAPKTVKNIYVVLHEALQTAYKVGYIKRNPADFAILPTVTKKEIKPLDNEGIKLFLNAVANDKYIPIYQTLLFTGMREGEALGLSWDCVNFKEKTITVKQQLQKERKTGTWNIVPTKNNKIRVIAAGDSLINILKKVKSEQIIINPMKLVFTHENGDLISSRTLYKDFKKQVEKIGYPGARVHDLRHSYAVLSLTNGDDIKTVQGNLGHATAAFTLDVYGHVTEQMKRDSANRMDNFIKSLA